MSAAPAGRREHLVFAVATATIVLHVFVDAFVALEPGVARAEHVLPAAVPVGIAVLAVSLYRRPRAGLRASVALLFGVLAWPVRVSWSSVPPPRVRDLRSRALDVRLQISEVPFPPLDMRCTQLMAGRSQALPPSVSQPQAGGVVALRA